MGKNVTLLPLPSILNQILHKKLDVLEITGAFTRP